MEAPKPDPLFAAGKAKWLLQNVDKLTEDERGLLLAIVKLEQDTGHRLTSEEQAALDKLAQASGFDPSEIAGAVDYIVTAQTKRPVDEWPSAIHKLKQKRKEDRGGK